MKKLALLAGGVAALAFLLPVASAADHHMKEGKEAKIKRAMSAAPMRISGEAKIVDVDGTVLKDGNNGWTCMPGVALIPGSKDPMCNDAVWGAWMAAAAAGKEFKSDKIGISYMLQGDAYVSNDSPAATDPNDGGEWIKEGPHLMLLIPENLKDSFPHTPSMGGPYVMWGQTGMFHVMVPVAERFK